MAFCEGPLIVRAQQRAGAKGHTVEEKLSLAARQRQSRYDIFLSQTLCGAKIVLGLYDLLTSADYIVFCGWGELPGAQQEQFLEDFAALAHRAL